METKELGDVKIAIFKAKGVVVETYRCPGNEEAIKRCMDREIARREFSKDQCLTANRMTTQDGEIMWVISFFEDRGEDE